MQRWSSCGWSLSLQCWLVGLLLCLVRSGEAAASPSLSEAVLDTAAQVRALNVQEAKLSRPVRIQGVVTFWDRKSAYYFVQDSTAGIYISPPEGQDFAVGQRVEVEGMTDPGLFAPLIRCSRITALGTGTLPETRLASLEQLINGAKDSQWIEVEGLPGQIQSDENCFKLKLRMMSESIEVEISRPPNQSTPPEWRGGKMRLRGVCATLFNSKRQFIGVRLLVPRLEEVFIDPKEDLDPFRAPLRSIDSLLQFRPMEARMERARIRGIVTYQGPRSLFVQDGSNALYVTTAHETSVKVNDQVEVSGFPEATGNAPRLSEAVVRRLGRGHPPSPLKVRAVDVRQNELDAQLIELQGYLQEHATLAGEQMLILQDGYATIPAFLRGSQADRKVDKLIKGSRLKLIGICSFEPGLDRQHRSFRLLLRSADDIATLNLPLEWTARRLLQTLAALGFLTLLGSLWIIVLKIEVKRQTTLARQRLEQETALEKRFSNLFENANDIIFGLDSDGRFTEMNRAAERVLGYSRQELFGKHFADLVVPKSRPILDQLMRGHNTDQKEDALCELIVKVQDGSERTLEVNPRAFLSRDVQVIARDISERKRAEADRILLENQLRQSQKLEGIGTLAGGMAHDFNNILGIILPYAELAKIDSTNNPKAQESLSEVIKAALRGRDLIRQILAFSRKAPIERKPIFLQPVIQEVLKMLRSTIPATIEIVDQVNPKAPRVLADSVQMHQVLVNLCTNAAHAMQETTGRMEVVLEPFQTSPRFLEQHPGMPAGEYARLSVRDTGHGMSASTLKRLFEPFFTTKAPGEGTGLGLAVVHGIIKEHKGQIDVRSQLGKGTEFDLYLPACQEHAMLGHAEAEVSLKMGSGERLLLVDDEPNLAAICGKILARSGYRVRIFHTPLEALEDFRRNPRGYDLIITDLTMPKMTGTDLARHLRKIRADVPILLATGNSGNWNREETRKLGVSDIILKPFTPMSLTEVVHKTLHDSNVGRTPAPARSAPSS